MLSFKKKKKKQQHWQEIRWQILRRSRRSPGSPVLRGVDPAAGPCCSKMYAFTFSLPKTWIQVLRAPWKELPTEEMVWKGQSTRQQKPRRRSTSSVNSGTSACWLGRDVASRLQVGQSAGSQNVPDLLSKLHTTPTKEERVKGGQIFSCDCALVSETLSMVSSRTPEGSKEPTSLDPGRQDPLSKPVLSNMLPLTEL